MYYQRFKLPNLNIIPNIIPKYQEYQNYFRSLKKQHKRNQFELMSSGKKNNEINPENMAKKINK